MKTTQLKQGIEKSNLIAEPFTTKYLDDEKEETENEILTIRINAKEREIINWIKETLHYTQDAKAIKVGLTITKNVIQNSFGSDLMSKLCSEKRNRPIVIEPTNK